MRAIAKFLVGFGSATLIAVLSASGSESDLPPYGFIAAEQGECVAVQTHLYPGAPVSAKGPEFQSPEDAFNGQSHQSMASYRRRDVTPSHVVFEKLQDGKPVAFVTVRNLPGQGWYVTETQEKAGCGTKLDKGEFLG